MSESSACAFSALDQLLAVVVGADDDGAAVEPAFAAPAAHQSAQDQPAAINSPRPTRKNAESHSTRDRVAELGEERDADEQQEDERPGRDHACHLPQVTAEDLHVVDVGRLEAEHGGAGDGDDRENVGPAEAVDLHHIAEIECDAGQADQQEIREADEAGDDDRGIGGVHLLADDRERHRRQAPPPLEPRD